MSPIPRRVAIIGAGPSGLAATHALASEKIFDTIRIFDRRPEVGGLWNYDQEPDVFPHATDGSLPSRELERPENLPGFAPAAPADPNTRTALYYALDSNVGASTMAFTWAPFPEANSPNSVRRLGLNNASRPHYAIIGWIEDNFKPFLPWISLSTTVEKVEKIDKEWVLTLRKSHQRYGGKDEDYWWTEKFDAVLVASGHYSTPYIPNISGVIETSKHLPGAFEHSKSYRKADKYVNKKVLIVGGSISATDFITDLHDVVKGKLELAVRTQNEALQAAYNLPNVQLRPEIKSITASKDGGVTVTFVDGESIQNVDHLIFATGYRFSYPYLKPDLVASTKESNRVTGLYQHVFSIEDPTLAFVGNVKAGLTFRVNEYQAVAIARFLAGRSAALPSKEDQRKWEAERLALKGPSSSFHEILPDFEPYFNWLADFAGEPAQESNGYRLPKWQDSLAEEGLALLEKKAKYWQSIIDGHNPARAKL
ncbi:unnamed protein product [Clonostachys rosea]|uniref:FAD/NAD(P)-binding domain-containing protein n=1 Tax=Bionectria ochroleuca TaxID=29856 RepID=A0ABY6UZ27_BIOOC|nr:unnamed protein product [Clonostachys rosea]